MSALLSVDGLTVRYPLSRGLGEILSGAPRRAIRAVEQVDLRLERGETLGLVGESGCGKSTLGRALLRLTAAEAGSIRFDGADVRALEGRQLLAFRRRAQMIFQDPFASLNPRRTVGATLSEVLHVHKICPAAEIDRKITRLMDIVGLPQELRGRRPGALSGGQCQRVGLARALAVAPELIISDESVSALDVSIQAQILNLFMRLKSEMNLTMIFISHDLGVVRHLCHRVAVMYLGRIVEVGATDEIFASPRHPYTQALLKAIPQMAPDATLSAAPVAGEPPSPIAVPPGCAYHPRCLQAMPACRSGAAPGLRPEGAASVACHLYGGTHGDAIVRVEALD